MFKHVVWLSVLLGVIAGRAALGEMPWVRVADDKRGFVLPQSARPFVPWGFNYDHDENGRLLEDYWDKEWPKVEEDFQEMKQLGANVVRIHLQVSKFMTGPEKTSEANLDRLGRLVAMAEKIGIYLDITGLGCYRKKDVPEWYDSLGEEQRWAVQARFWEAVAGRCAKSPAVFCYDLMNEPVVPGGTRKPGDWLGPPFLGSESGYFVQCITLEQKERRRPAIARQWCHRLAAAIRRRDQRHLVTVGLVPWSLDRPGLTSGFVPKEIAPELDFIAVHLYPEKDKTKEAIATLSGFGVGKPVVIEEMFPLGCPLPQFEQFLDESRKTASGWIGFYWGKTPDEYRRSHTIQDALVLGWLELFQKRAADATGRAAEQSPLNVLFIGNSYTFVNDLPSLIVGLAEAAGGRKIEADRHLVGGCTLERHVREKKAVEKIRAKKWDVVVLQEHSLQPIIDRESMYRNARILDAEIKKQGAKTVFYLTWARQNIPEMQEGADPDKSAVYARAMYQMSEAAKKIAFEPWSREHKSGLTSGLNGAYFGIAKELAAEVAPVGVAWKKAMAADPKLALHQADKSHPNPAGSYLAACVFYATLLGKSPVGLPGKLGKEGKLLVQIAPDEAKRLQEIAWQTVQETRRGSRFTSRPPPRPIAQVH